MTLRSKLLTGENPTPAPPPAKTETPGLDDFVVILAVLFCAIICLLGLVAIARCAWLRRLSGRGIFYIGSPTPPANRALKKKVLMTLPKMTYPPEELGTVKFTECTICLTEFATGDEIRLLPQCGHGYHVECIDTWLATHSSCPSCRKVLVAVRCQKCGELPSSSAPAGAQTGTRTGHTTDHVNTFLP